MDQEILQDAYDRAKEEQELRFNPEGAGYDYESAVAAGLDRDATGHWPSREPKTGLILKGKSHPSFHATEEGEKKAGYTIYKKDNRYYSHPNTTADPKDQRRVAPHLRVREEVEQILNEPYAGLKFIGGMAKGAAKLPGAIMGAPQWAYEKAEAALRPTIEGIAGAAPGSWSGLPGRGIADYLARSGEAQQQGIGEISSIISPTPSGPSETIGEATALTLPAAPLAAYESLTEPVAESRPELRPTIAAGALVVGGAGGKGKGKKGKGFSKGEIRQEFSESARRPDRPHSRPLMPSEVEPVLPTRETQLPGKSGVTVGRAKEAISSLAKDKAYVQHMFKDKASEAITRTMEEKGLSYDEAVSDLAGRLREISNQRGGPPYKGKKDTKKMEGAPHGTEAGVASPEEVARVGKFYRVDSNGKVHYSSKDVDLGPKDQAIFRVNPNGKLEVYGTRAGLSFKDAEAKYGVAVSKAAGPPHAKVTNPIKKMSEAMNRKKDMPGAEQGHHVVGFDTLEKIDYHLKNLPEEVGQPVVEKSNAKIGVVGTTVDIPREKHAEITARTLEEKAKGKQTPSSPLIEFSQAYEDTVSFTNGSNKLRAGADTPNGRRAFHAQLLREANGLKGKVPEFKVKDIIKQLEDIVDPTDPKAWVQLELIAQNIHAEKRNHSTRLMMDLIRKDPSKRTEIQALMDQINKKYEPVPEGLEPTGVEGIYKGEGEKPGTPPPGSRTHWKPENIDYAIASRMRNVDILTGRYMDHNQPLPKSIAQYNKIKAILKDQYNYFRDYPDKFLEKEGTLDKGTLKSTYLKQVAQKLNELEMIDPQKLTDPKVMMKLEEIAEWAHDWARRQLEWELHGRETGMGIPRETINAAIRKYADAQQKAWQEEWIAYFGEDIMGKTYADLDRTLLDPEEISHGYGGGWEKAKLESSRDPYSLPPSPLEPPPVKVTGKEALEKMGLAEDLPDRKGASESRKKLSQAIVDLMREEAKAKFNEMAKKEKPYGGISFEERVEMDKNFDKWDLKQKIRAEEKKAHKNKKKDLTRRQGLNTALERSNPDVSISEEIRKLAEKKKK